MIYQSFFQKMTEYDRRHRKLRKRNEYWQRVWYFYKNNDWGGWDEIERQLLKRITISSTPTFSRLRERLNRLGLRLCAEWAKHDDVRKIDSKVLQKFPKKLKNAPVPETAIGEIEKELDQRDV